MRYHPAAHAGAVAACLAAGSAVASDGTDAVRLNPLLVTSTLSTETAESSVSSVTVIDREQLDRQQPRELSDALRGQPGIDLTTNGAFGKSTGVFTRGTGSESTILLIDGIRIRSATSGGAPWQFIPPQLVDRMEIVRGPKGSLYGADAVGGVVQAFTPDGRDGDARWIQAGGGSFDSHEVGAGIAGSSGGTAWSLAGNHFDTEGEPVREGGEDRGFRNTAGIGRIHHRFDNGVRLGALGFRAQGNTEFYQGETDFLVQTVGANAEIPVTDGWLARVQLSEGRDEAETEQDFGRSVFNTATRTARLENAFALGRHQAVVGASFQRDEIDSTTAYEEDERDNTAVFSQLLLDDDPASLQLSLRWDDNEAFGDRVTGGAAMGYWLDETHRVRLSYGTAFRAPTFNELYFPGFGNPDLSAERSRTAELGIRGQYPRGFWDVAVYQTQVDNLIGTDLASFTAQNIARAEIQGVEFGAGASLAAWELYGAVSLLDPRDKETGNRLARRTTHSARFDADRQLGAFSVGASVILQGDRYNDADNEERLSGFGLVNLRAGWSFARNWSARLTVDNVFDRAYATTRRTSSFDPNAPFDYRGAGRSAFLSVRYGAR